MIRLTPREAECLSYLQGRGAVGDWVPCRNKDLQRDLAFKDHSGASHYVTKLMLKGVIKKYGDSAMVLKRLEHDDVYIGISEKVYRSPVTPFSHELIG